MKKLTKSSQYEKIVAHMTDPNSDGSGLTPHEQEMCNRWNEAWTLIRNYHSTSDAAAILMKRFPGLSRATAYRDCTNAVSMFGDISKSTKEGIRHLSTEIIKDSVAIARLKNNEDGMRLGGLAIAKVGGVNDTDPDLPDFSLLESNTYEFALPESFMNVLQVMVSGGKIDLRDMVNSIGKHAEEAIIVPDQEEHNESD
ncbi:hypothetical protein [Pedobacter antarcticus]|uniref:hypothetical protein n=1 Tax=Pedobacter antarcticus TaxID=34086 RepID=UPI00088D0294|nr:hypothetical protein [Pedobacter antarcticus]SDM40533.1 hypothetical protein SAMN04488084_106169 [Pedobacter antarcticus]